MKQKFIVIGGSGLMGRIVVRDLVETAKDAKIVIADFNVKKAKTDAKKYQSKRVTGVFINAQNQKAVAKLIKGSTVVLNCAQYYFNVPVMKACLTAKAHYVDLGGLFHGTKKQLKLNQKFNKAGLTAVVGCGGTPGITNVLAAYAAGFLDKIQEIKIRFAGADWTDYKMPFIVPYSMATIFDEFMLKPAVFTKGKTKFVEPHSGFEVTHFPKPILKADSFYTLHSEIATMPSSFKNKGVKEVSFKVNFSNDFVNQILFLVNAGLASDKPVFVKGEKIIPRNVTIAQLNKLIPGKDIKVNDLEFLKVEVLGKKDNKKKQLSVYCKAKSLKKWNAAAGDVDTGTPCSIIAQMIANNVVTKKGVFAPELGIEPMHFFKQLKKRGMQILVEKNNRIKRVV